MSSPRKIIRLKDIAEATGYSINTVSRALRDKSDISEATRKQIQEVAEKMGHINNSVAISLRLGYTKTIAVILGDISNPFFAIQMKALEERAHKSGYSIFLLNTNEDEDIEREAIITAINKMVAGIIICPAQKSHRNIELLQSSNIPFTLMGRRFPDIATDYVISNDEAGGYLATEMLIKRGHQNILCIHCPTYISSGEERLKGYCRALKDNDIEINKKLIVEVPPLNSNLKSILSRIPIDNYSAVFAFSDLIAWEVWSYLKESGQRVPQDKSIIGFDNIQSRLKLPFKLDTINSYKEQMATFAIELLLKRIEGDTSSTFRIVLDSDYVEGESLLQKKNS